MSTTNEKLHPDHLDMLAKSGISPQFAALRGYETIENSRSLKALGLAKAAHNLVPGLMFPLLRADGSVAGWQYRPDNPRLRKGKPAKYEIPTGQSNVIDVPPGVGDWLPDPGIELWVTEGTKKADCGAIRGLCIVSINGVYGWRGTNGSHGKTALPDWHDIALNGRRVILAFDSDASRKPQVRRALREFADWLKTRGARVEYLHLPDNDDGKVGLDDYLVDGHTIAELHALVKDEPPGDDRQSPIGPPDWPKFDDARISEYISERYLKARFRHSGGLGWMHYDGKRWSGVGEPIVTEAVRQAVLEFHGEALQLYASGAITQDQLDKTFRLLSANRMSVIVKLSKGYLNGPDDKWDAHPDLLNVANGVVDLRDGSVSRHDPDLLLTKLCPTEYDSSAEHSDWKQALEAVPEQAREWLALRLGQGLTGHPTPDDVLLLLKGTGENGKTTLITGILKAIGSDYAVMLPDRALLARPSDHPTEIMTLRGTRLAIMEELPELGHLNIKRLKTICGTPVLSARYCGKDTVSWEATHTVIVTTNYWPRVDESDHGTWRRLMALEFPFCYRKSHEGLATGFDKRGDPGLRDRIKHGLHKQHEAVLAWLVAGAVTWYQNGRVMGEPPAEVANALREWRAGADLLLSFRLEKIVFDPAAHMMSRDVQKMFEEWLKARGHAVWSDQTFTDRWAAHPDVMAAGVTKKTVRRAQPGLRRPPLAGSDVPNQFRAWVGMRPRYDSDDVDEL